MARETLTDQKVKRLPPAPPGKRRDHWDAIVPGLSLRVTDRGRKSWSVVSRLRGKPVRATLGPYPALGVKAAREKARTALESILSGIHPRRAKREGTVLVGDALEAYEAERAKFWRRAYAANVRSALKLYIRPALAEVPVDDVTRAELRALLAQVAADYPARAVSVRAHLSAFFRWAFERDMIESNPCAGLRPPAELHARDRVYSDPEIRAIWGATETALVWPYGPFVRFLLVTAQRRAQVRDMRWTEIDESRAVWTSRTKEKRLHPLPLSDLAQEILAAAPHRGEYVFSVLGNRGVTNMSYVARKLREAEGVPSDFRLHDLRRTAATRMAELGVKPWVVDAILDHVAGGVTGVYQRYGYVEEMREALALWAGRLRQILAMT